MEQLTRVWVRDSQDVPRQGHYVIIEFGTKHVPGDERSRTNPGHGYPAHTESVIDYIVFPNPIEWEREITRRSSTKSCPNNWVAAFVSPAEITTKTTVTVKKEN